jgi:hypothetical protein
LDLERAEWWFVLKWVFASTLSVAAGAGVDLAILLAMAWLADRSAGDALWSILGSNVIGAIVNGALWALFGAAAGAVVGIAQWLVLRKHVRPSGWWVPATAAGWAVGAVALSTALYVDEVLAVVVGMVSTGAAAGAAQWMVLRKRFHRTGWWAPAGAVAWIVAVAVAWAAMRTVAGFVMGYITGAIMTGFVLVKLLRHPQAISSSCDQGHLAF